MVASVIDHPLATVHRKRRPGGNLARNRHHLGQHARLIGKDAIDQAAGLRLPGRHAPAGVGQFANNPLGNQLDQPRESADISGHANVDLIDGDEGVLAGIAHVAGGNQVDPATDTAALDGGEHRNAALLERGEGALHALNAVVKTGPVLQARSARSVLAGRDAVIRKHAGVDARGEMRSGRRNDDHPRPGVGIDIFDDLRQFLPEGADHVVALFGAVENDVRNAVGNRHVKTLVGHRSLLRCGLLLRHRLMHPSKL